VARAESCTTAARRLHVASRCINSAAEQLRNSSPEVQAKRWWVPPATEQCNSRESVCVFVFVLALTSTPPAERRTATERDEVRVVEKLRPRRDVSSDATRSSRLSDSTCSTSCAVSPGARLCCLRERRALCASAPRRSIRTVGLSASSWSTSTITSLRASRRACSRSTRRPTLSDPGGWS
jgi:hypothetical protein